MKTAISIPDSVFKAAEKVAKRLGMSRSELYQMAVAEFLARHAERNITEKLDEVYVPEHETASVPQDMQWMQATSIPEERW